MKHSKAEAAVGPLPISPDDVAKDHYNQAGGDVQKATRSMVNEVLSDLALYRALMDPLVQGACYDRIRGVCRQSRAAIWNMPQPSAKVASGRVVTLAKAVVSAYLNFPLPGGKKLGDATRPEVQKARMMYGAQSADMGAKERWLYLIESKLPDDTKLVSQILDDAALGKLRAKAEKAGGKVI